MKIVLVGDSQVGKTCVLTRLTMNTFQTSNPATIGAAYKGYKISTEKGTVDLQLWDTAGQEKFKTLAPMYYRSAEAALVFFDITNLTSFQSLDSWITEIEEKGGDNIHVYVVGYKCDMDSQRVLSKEDAKELVFSHNCEGYFETSAKTGEGVLDLFIKVAECASELHPNQEKKENVVDVTSSTANNDESGCKC